MFFVLLCFGDSRTLGGAMVPSDVPTWFFFLYSKEMNHRHLLIMEAELQMVQTTLLLINE